LQNIYNEDDYSFVDDKNGIVTLPYQYISQFTFILVILTYQSSFSVSILYTGFPHGRWIC